MGMMMDHVNGGGMLAKIDMSNFHLQKLQAIPRFCLQKGLLTVTSCSPQT